MKPPSFTHDSCPECSSGGVEEFISASLTHSNSSLRKMHQENAPEKPAPTPKEAKPNTWDPFTKSYAAGWSGSCEVFVPPRSLDPSTAPTANVDCTEGRPRRSQHPITSHPNFAVRRTSPKGLTKRRVGHRLVLGLSIPLPDFSG